MRTEERFLAYARNELPEYYCISYEDDLGTKRNPFINQKQSFCAIINSCIIRNDKEFLDAFFGCPFNTGIDVFPLDRVFNNSQKEQDRVRRANLVFSVYCTYLIITNETFYFCLARHHGGNHYVMFLN